MALPQDGQNANGLTKVTEIPKGKELIFIDPTTNEGGIITLEDLTTQILKNLTSQTFTLDQGNITLIEALNKLNSNPGKAFINLLSIREDSSFSAALKGRNYKMIVGYFYAPADNPFSFKGGYYLAFQSLYLQENDRFTIIGFGNKGEIENKIIQIK